MNQAGELSRGISGSNFAYEMQYLQDKCKSVNVRINSIGGSVIDGYSIVSAILTSKVPVNTFIDGLAASIAGVIAVAGTKCTMMDYGTLMMHNASGSEDEAMLDLVNGTICTILSNRCGKSKEEVFAMMEQETWLTADEAKAGGFIDEISNSSKQVKVNKGSLSNMATMYNQLINKPTMEKVLNVLSVKNEDEVLESIEAFKAEITTLNEKLAGYEAKEKEAAEAAELALKNKATEFAEQLEKDKKITSDEKPNVIENLIANFDFVSNVFSKIKVAQNAVKVFDVKNIATKKGTEDRSDWTIRDWEKKDTAGLAEMKNSTPEIYTELFNKFYKPQN